MKWVTVWGNATSVAERRPETYARAITLRYPVTCALGGKRVRLHFSNFCGTEPVVLARVSLAYALTQREIDEKSAVCVTFGGSERVTIPAGGEIVSDEIPFTVEKCSKITVSIYLDGFTLMRSAVVITGPLSGGFFSLGDRTLSPALPLDTTRSEEHTSELQSH